MVTIKDIAAKANVSLTTASMVLNNKASSVRISEKTKQHVLSLAASMGYIPNMSARQLRQTGENVLTLALLLPSDSRVSMIGEILSGIQQYITSDEIPMNCSLVVETYKQGEIAEVKGLAYPNRFNGAIAANLSADDQLYLHEEPSKVPCVLLQRISPLYSYVDADNFNAGCAMAKHFLGNGHREWIILTPAVSSDAVNRRVEGILHELSLWEGPKVIPLIRHCEFSEEGGYQAVQSLLSEAHALTAIICLSDPIAVGALSALHEAGVSVPGQCEVMGCDNMTASRFTIPKLSTVDIPVRQMARHAAGIVINQIFHPHLPQEMKTFDTSLIHRQTTRRG